MLVGLFLWLQEAGGFHCFQDSHACPSSLIGYKRKQNHYVNWDTRQVSSHIMKEAPAESFDLRILPVWAHTSAELIDLLPVWNGEHPDHCSLEGARQ